MAQVLENYGTTEQRLSLTPANQTLFWDITEQNLYIYIRNTWILLGGLDKNNKFTAGTNLRIYKKDNQTIIDLLEDIDIDKLNLKPVDNQVIFSNFYDLGIQLNSNFFPLFEIDSNNPAFLGGTIYTQTTLNGKNYRGIYFVTARSVGSCSIVGGDESNVKISLAEAELSNGKKYVGLKTFIKENLTEFTYPESVRVWFSGWKDIKEELIPLNFDRSDITLIKNLSEED